jgi:hypothetical protein
MALDLQPNARFVAVESGVLQLVPRQTQTRPVEDPQHANNARSLFDPKDDSVRFEDQLTQIQTQIIGFASAAAPLRHRLELANELIKTPYPTLCIFGRASMDVSESLGDVVFGRWSNDDIVNHRLSLIPALAAISSST